MFFALAIASVLLRGNADGDLIAKLLQRDPAAMGELYDRYGRVAFSVIVRIVRNEGVAEELLQETFLRVWNRMAGFDKEKGNLGPWLITVARNQAVDYLRSVEGRAAKNGLPLEQVAHPVVHSDFASDIHDADLLRKIGVAIEKLNENQRQVIKLAYFEGLSQSEMAERTNQPLGTVKTWMRTALRILREELKESVPV